MPNYTQWFRDTFKFNDSCRACKLAHSDQKENPPIAGTTGAKHITDIKLIVISDHPGYYEVKNGYCMYDNAKERQSKPLARMNAGAYLRQVIESWGLNSYTQVYFTNAVKCEPGSKTVLAEHLRFCRRKWLVSELVELDTHVPSVPILICGTKAFDSMIPLIKETMLDSKASLNKYRRRVLHYNQHPVVATYNPASVASSIPRIETQDINKMNSIDSVIELPTLPVSPVALYNADLLPLKQLLCKDIP